MNIEEYVKTVLEQVKNGSKDNQQSIPIAFELLLNDKAELVSFGEKPKGLIKFQITL
jgi:hypothetical protein